MITKINVSKKATSILTHLHNTIRLRPNLIARNALMLSMENGDRYNSKNDVDTSGKEFNSYTLFGENEKIFEMMLRQYYGNEFDENHWGTVISFHINKGLDREDFHAVFDPKI